MVPEELFQKNCSRRIVPEERRNQIVMETCLLAKATMSDCASARQGIRRFAIFVNEPEEGGGTAAMVVSLVLGRPYHHACLIQADNGLSNQEVLPYLVVAQTLPPQSISTASLTPPIRMLLHRQFICHDPECVTGWW